jgi:hypothetical protein
MMNTNENPSNLDVIDQLFEDRLRDEVQGAIEEHLDSCPAGRERLEAAAAEANRWQRARNCLPANILLQEIVEKLHEKDPSKRFQSAAEVTELLEGCLAHVHRPIDTPLPAVLTAPTAAKRPLAGRKKIGLVAAACIAIFLTGIGFFSAALGRDNDPPSIPKLVAQLGSYKFAERETATKALDQIGAPALEALLKASLSDDAERRRRAQALVEKIEGRELAVRVRTPKRVHLVFGDTPLAAKAVLRPQVLANEAQEKQPLPAQPQAAGMVERNGILLTDGKAMHRPSDGTTSVRVRVEGHARISSDGQLQLAIRIRPEPKLPGVELAAVRIMKAIDNLGQSLEQALPAPRGRLGNQLGQPRQQVHDDPGLVVLKCITPPTSLRELSGTITIRQALGAGSRIVALDMPFTLKDVSLP